MTKPQVIYCVAGSQAESEYARRQAGRSPREWRYLSDGNRLRGVLAPHWIAVGTWEKRRDLEDLLYELRIAGGVRVHESDARKERAG